MRQLVVCVAAAFAVLLVGAAAQNNATTDTAAQNNTTTYNGFIRVSNGRFVDADCKEYLFSGWNGWNLVDTARTSQGKDFIRGLFRRAAALSLDQLRLFTEDYGVDLMTSPGVFNEEAFQALDFILDEAARAGLKIVLVPLNFWNKGVSRFEEWCGSNTNTTIPRPDLDIRPQPLNASEREQTPYDWYVNDGCRQIYKDFLRTLITRRNSVNGLLYRDDPVIFSWNIMNEPRCKYCGPDAVNSWYHDMAAFIKSIDSNHMVTTGEEGFFDETSPFSAANPNDGNLWGGRTGQDFVSNHASPNIDYAVMHLWADNWSNPPLDLQFGQAWIDAHIQAAQQLGKPLVMEEFGKNSPEYEIPTVRDPWFNLVYNAVNASLNSGGVLRGALFWQWDGYNNGPRDGGSNLRDSDSTFTSIIEPFSHRLALNEATLHRAAGGGQVEGCTPVQYAGAVPAALPESAGVVNSAGGEVAGPGGRRLLKA